MVLAEASDCIDLVTGTKADECFGTPPIPPLRDCVSSFGAGLVLGIIFDTFDANDCMEGVKRAPALRILSLISFCCSCISFHLDSRILSCDADAFLSLQIMMEMAEMRMMTRIVDQVKLLVFLMSTRLIGLDFGALVKMRLTSETTASGWRWCSWEVISVTLGPPPVVTKLAGLSLSGTAEML